MGQGNAKPSVFVWPIASGTGDGHGKASPQAESFAIITARMVEALKAVPIRYVACGAYHAAAISESGDLYTWSMTMDPYNTAATSGSLRSAFSSSKPGSAEPSGGGYSGTGRHSDKALLRSQLEMLQLPLGHGNTFAPTSEQHSNKGDSEMAATSLLSTPRVLKYMQNKSIKQVSCGDHHTAAVTDSGALWTWGLGQNGRLGHGVEDVELVPRLVEALACGQPPCSPNAPLQTSSATSTAALQNTLVTYTNNQSAAMAGPSATGVDGVTLNHSQAAHSPVAGTTAPSGSRHDSVKNGLGVQAVPNSPLPSEAGTSNLGAMFVTSVACGGFHTICLAVHSSSSGVSGDSTNQKSVFTWGLGLLGRLGHGNESDQLLPTKVEFFETCGIMVEKVAAGRHHSGVVTDEGKIYTWGGGAFGKLGIATSQSSQTGGCNTSLASLSQLVPGVVLLDSSGSQQVTDLALGREHSMCVTSKGEVFTWGQGGRLGHGPSDGEADEPLPRKVSHLSRVFAVQAACNDAFSVVLTETGEAIMWGSNPADHLSGKGIVGAHGISQSEPAEPDGLHALASSSFVGSSDISNHTARGTNSHAEAQSTDFLSGITYGIVQAPSLVQVACGRSHCIGLSNRNMLSTIVSRTHKELMEQKKVLRQPLFTYQDILEGHDGSDMLGGHSKGLGPSSLIHPPTTLDGTEAEETVTSLSSQIAAGRRQFSSDGPGMETLHPGKACPVSRANQVLILSAELQLYQEQMYLLARRLQKTLKQLEDSRQENAQLKIQIEEMKLWADSQAGGGTATGKMEALRQEFLAQMKQNDLPNRRTPAIPSHSEVGLSTMGEGMVSSGTAKVPFPMSPQNIMLHSAQGYDTRSYDVSFGADAKAQHQPDIPVVILGDLTKDVTPASKVQNDHNNTSKDVHQIK